MKGINRFLVVIIALALIFAESGCSVEPESIDYGEEACHFCQMKIVDEQYAAEIVTDKGKIYKFDAIECMINYDRKELKETTVAYRVANTYDDPRGLHDVKACHFLRSPALPSPMGMYITAFEDMELAKDYAQRHGGELYSWQQLTDDFERVPVLAEDIRH